MTMVPPDPETPEDDDDLLAAEYVLGVLGGEEREALARRIEGDAGFAGLVDRWELLLAPLSADFPSVAPPESVKEGLDLLLYADQVLDRGEGEGARRRPGLWRSLGFWRGLAAASLAALLIAVVLPFLPLEERPELRFAAALESGDSDVRYLAVYDADNEQINLSRISGEAGAGRTFELWKIEGDRAPVSLGLIPAGQTAALRLLPDRAEGLNQGVVLAISQEPEGGSPTGQPTGPVVAVGALQPI